MKLSKVLPKPNKDVAISSEARIFRDDTYHFTGLEWTDLNMHMQIDLPYDYIGEQPILGDVNHIRQLDTLADDGFVGIKSIPDSFSYRFESESLTASYHGHDPWDFPEKPTFVPMHTTLVNSSDFMAAIDFATTVIPKKSDKKLDVVMIECKKEYISVYGSDSKRLNYYKLATMRKGSEFQAMIPIKYINTFSYLASLCNEVEIEEDTGRDLYRFRFGQHRIIVRRHRDDFPNYLELIPAREDCNIAENINRKALQADLKRIDKVAGKTEYQLNFSKDGIKARLIENQEIKLKTGYNIPAKGDYVPRYLKDALGSISASEVDVCFHPETSMLIIRNGSSFCAMMALKYK